MLREEQKVIVQEGRVLHRVLRPTETGYWKTIHNLCNL